MDTLRALGGDRTQSNDIISTINSSAAAAGGGVRVRFDAAADAGGTARGRGDVHGCFAGEQMRGVVPDACDFTPGASVRSVRQPTQRSIHRFVCQMLRL